MFQFELSSVPPLIWRSDYSYKSKYFSSRVKPVVKCFRRPWKQIVRDKNYFPLKKENMELYEMPFYYTVLIRL